MPYKSFDNSGHPAIVALESGVGDLASLTKCGAATVVILSRAQNGMSGVLAGGKHARRRAAWATPRTGDLGHLAVCEPNWVVVGADDGSSDVSLPGAVVAIDPYGGRNRILSWLWVTVQLPVRGANWRPLEKRDVVIFDESRKTVLFREGPYSSRVASDRLAALVVEVETDGIREFLRKQQIVEGRIGPVKVDVPSTSAMGYLVDSIRRWLRRAPH